MARNYPRWTGALRVALEDALRGGDEYTQFRAERTLQQFLDGYDVPDAVEIREAWDAQQEAENDD